ncbi:hypothetical protein ABAC402_06180 [Asticcacaulis sp. AC402]|nr:hypothetical protein ABAC402_06180 [Asticcacaulis sp. AC402]
MAACEKAPEPAAAAKVEVSALPRTQTDFLTALAMTSNPAGVDRFCTAFTTTPGFADWVATVRDSQTSTLNRSIGITFDVGDGIKLEQVVQADNSLHEAVERLLIGDKVTISGAFTHGNGECGYSLDSFGIRLSDIR